MNLKLFILCTISIATCSLFGQNLDYPIRPVSFNHVKIDDKFWLPKININADVSIPHTLSKCETEDRMANFKRAAGVIKDNKSSTYPFDDSDLYKVIEGASYSLQSKPNPLLEKYLDTLIALIGSAQEPDGYLFTFRTMPLKEPHPWLGKSRWELDEDLSHELYNVGHLYEAASAHFLATGKRNLLNIALKNADLHVKEFGYGKTEKFPGHQIIETGLVKLYRITGKKEYLDLAKFFLDLRGQEGHLNQEYSQSHKKVTEQTTAVGHAVRATYMYSGMADIAALTGDKDYKNALNHIWEDVVQKKLYITGGIGATGNGEAFGEDYFLPNMSAYAETCAAIASVYWNMRMFAMTGESKYIDILERTLYNGLVSGVSLSGDHFFYPNPLASIGQHQRSDWHNCACCVSNMTRFLPSMPGYIYAQDEKGIFVNLFASSSANISYAKNKINIQQITEYPWDGKIMIKINPVKKEKFDLKIRIPGWANGQPTSGDLYFYKNPEKANIVILTNGKVTPVKIENGYAIINKLWKKGDVVTFELPMEVKKVVSNNQVAANQKKIALELGPIVYCIESPDNESSISNLLVSEDVEVNKRFDAGLLGGVNVLHLKGKYLFQNADSTVAKSQEQPLKAIPYYTWANRGPSEMLVWIPHDVSVAKPKSPLNISKYAKVSSSINNARMLKAINDHYIPQDSSDREASYLHWWPKKNTTEWVEYHFDEKKKVTESSVYWFDDGPWGGCRTPVSWRILYKSGSDWYPAQTTESYKVIKNQLNKVTFTPVETTAIRMEVVLPEQFSAGIYEWIIN